MASSQWVIDVTAETFQKDVIDQSKVRPVVMDFWAPWCGPCRTLGPKLEALANERNGDFVLAKVNTDDNPELAQSFQVNGIPAVYAIRNGTLIDQFTGAIPADQLSAFIDRLIPSADEQEEAHALEMEGRDPTAAAMMYRGILARNPNSPGARVGLARVLLSRSGQEAEAQNLLTGVSFDDHLKEAARLRTILQFRETAHSDSDLQLARARATENPSDASALYALGSVLAAQGHYQLALDSLLQAADHDRVMARDKVRELMVKIFDVIGPRSPEADQYRKRLQMLLY